MSVGVVLVDGRSGNGRAFAFIMACLVFGCALGFWIARGVSAEAAKALAAELKTLAKLAAAGGEVFSLKKQLASACLPLLAAAALGATGAGKAVLPMWAVIRGFLLSYAVSSVCLSLGRKAGFFCALGMYGASAVFVLPCTLFVLAEGLALSATVRHGVMPQSSARLLPVYFVKTAFLTAACAAGVMLGRELAPFFLKLSYGYMA